MRILVDTNVLLRLIELTHQQSQTCQDAVSLLQQRGHELAISPQVLYEFWVVATRAIVNNGLGLTPQEAQVELASIQLTFRLLPDDHTVFAHWLRLVTSFGVIGKQAHDARIVAAMMSHSVSHLLTINTADFKRYSAITIMSPDDVARGVIPN